MFRFLLFGAIALTYLVMIWGGLVRSTDSGLACPDWPLCYGQFSMPLDKAARLEMGHRILSSFAGLFVFGLFLLTVFGKYSLKVKLFASAALFFTFSAAITGMKMIKLEAPNLSSHFHMALESFHIFESMLILASLLFVYRAYRGSFEGAIPIWAYALAILTMVSGVIVRYTGSGEACGHEWPTCAGSLIGDISNWQVGLQVLHRNLAYLTWLGFLTLALTNKDRTSRLAFVLINVQMISAISMVKSGFFLPLVFIDVTHGFFLFMWLTYNLSLSRKAEVLKPAWQGG
ncbi:MAG: COX15/CtaA family protein [Aquificaceae bacterium]|nr:COX15/CtaA family protein [Aquificaceae bacterium]MDW8237201.1 COX15/CtaA family protein [Aquificaceae bacterium]